LFIHSLGHGTGLAVHEAPGLHPRSADVLKNGMVFSIEPGVYSPRLGGIRIEDLVYLKNGKLEYFVKVPTDLKSNIIK
jgi:Xaa-Pro aminopeptidase